MGSQRANKLLSRLFQSPQESAEDPWEKLTPEDPGAAADDAAASEPMATDSPADAPVSTAEAAVEPALDAPTAAEPRPPSSGAGDGQLDGMLARIEALTGQDVRAANAEAAPGVHTSAPEPEPEAEERRPTPEHDEFFPHEPQTLRKALLTDSEVEELILKYLLSRGDANGRAIASQIKLPFLLTEPLLRQLKVDQLVHYRAAAEAGDYVYQLTELGRERARRHSRDCTYYGSAPVAFRDYIESIQAQSITKQRPMRADLERAFDDLLISDNMFRRLGPAVNSGRGMFLFGYPGNGKTSIAERITAAFGETIWIPRAIGVDGAIIRIFDPMNHTEAPLEESEGLWNASKIDQRWVRIRRPTIIAGGELTMDNLEVRLNRETGISEAPLQMKSNCGTLVIDDFGRQRMSTDELLNRWIVPLEKRYDFLNLHNGKKLQVPFDQLIVFSTNLEPKDLVDDAFLRRIPYKIEVPDPTEAEFRELFHIMCPLLGFEYQQGPIDHVIATHYHATKRPFRCCQPRDLLQQIRNHCLYEKKPLELTNEAFDFAASNYFAIM